MITPHVQYRSPTVPANHGGRNVFSKCKYTKSVKRLSASDFVLRSIIRVGHIITHTHIRTVTTLAVAAAIAVNDLVRV